MESRIILLALMVTLLSACKNQLQDYVKSTKPSNFDQPSTAENSPMSLKVSPGRMSASATNGAIVGAVTPTNRTFMAGSDMAVSLTIHRTRVSPQ